MKSINTIEVEAQASDIFTYLMDIKNRGKYIPQLKDVIPIDPLPFKEGSKYIEVATIANRELRTTYQITVLVKDQIISARTIDSIFPIQVDLLLQSMDDYTRLTIQLEFQLKGIFKLGSKFVKRIVDEQSRGILARIKDELD